MIVNVDLPPAVICEGLKVATALEVKPGAVRLISCEKFVCGLVAITSKVAVEPCTTVCEDGASVKAKSCDGAMVNGKALVAVPAVVIS